MAVEEGSSDAQAVLLSAAFMRILGRPDEAREMLEIRMDNVDLAAGLTRYQSVQWVETIYAYGVGEASFEALEELAEESPHAHRLMGEAYFHAAAIALAAGKRHEARDDFDRAYRSFNGSTNLSFCARIILGKLDANADWPDWIPRVPGDQMRIGDVEAP